MTNVFSDINPKWFIKMRIPRGLWHVHRLKFQYIEEYQFIHHNGFGRFVGMFHLFRATKSPKQGPSMSTHILHSMSESKILI